MRTDDDYARALFSESEGGNGVANSDLQELSQIYSAIGLGRTPVPLGLRELAEASVLERCRSGGLQGVRVPVREVPTLRPRRKPRSRSMAYAVGSAIVAGASLTLLGQSPVLAEVIQDVRHLLSGIKRVTFNWVAVPRSSEATVVGSDTLQIQSGLQEVESGTEAIAIPKELAPTLMVGDTLRLPMDLRASD